RSRTACCAPGQIVTHGLQVFTFPCVLASTLRVESIRSLGRKPLLPAKVRVDAARGARPGCGREGGYVESQVARKGFFPPLAAARWRCRNWTYPTPCTHRRAGRGRRLRVVAAS